LKNRFFQLKSYFTYWLDAVDEHSLHSPFFFELYTTTLKGLPDADSFDTIERFRSKFLSANQCIDVVDFGSGSSLANVSSRRISKIAATSLSPKKYSQLYRRILDRFNCQNILELGTSLGINTLYLASRKGCSVNTFEGSPSLAEAAQKLFHSAGVNNVEVIPGNIDETLPEFIQTAERIDFAFLDANHRYEPTLKYFYAIIRRVHQHSVMVLDDIHYSGEMERAWREIQHHPSVYGTADIYRCGLVFFDPSLNRQNHVLQF
jgi:predicted O-methyltransferase YrrM